MNKEDIEPTQENKKSTTKHATQTGGRISWKQVILLPIWTYGSFLLATGAMYLLISLITLINRNWLASLNQVVLMTAISVAVYVVALVIAIGTPWLIKKSTTTFKEVGVPDWPAWMDIFLSVPAYVVYMILTMVMMFTAQNLLPDVININQSQSLPFSPNMIYSRAQMMLVFTTLVVLAPIAEELLFRGYLHGKLRKISPAWLTILVTSLAFGLAHLWAGDLEADLQWAVMLDTMMLGVVLSTLREATGAIWAGVLVHAIKNGIAFYFLYVSPQTIDQMRAAISLLM